MSQTMLLLQEAREETITYKVRVSKALDDICHTPTLPTQVYTAYTSPNHGCTCLFLWCEACHQSRLAVPVRVYFAKHSGGKQVLLSCGGMQLES